MVETHLSISSVAANTVAIESQKREDPSLDAEILYKAALANVTCEQVVSATSVATSLGVATRTAQVLLSRMEREGVVGKPTLKGRRTL